MYRPVAYNPDQLPMSVIPQKKPTTLGNQHIEGFRDWSVQAREKWGVKIITNFWTPCMWENLLFEGLCIPNSRCGSCSCQLCWHRQSDKLTKVYICRWVNATAMSGSTLKGMPNVAVAIMKQTKSPRTRDTWLHTDTYLQTSSPTQYISV